MSMDTGDPTATDISLTCDEEADQWRARDETRGVTVRASTREAALDALDEAVADDGETDPDVEVSTLTTRSLQHRRFRVVGQMSPGTSTGTSLRTPIGTNSALTRAPEWR